MKREKIFLAVCAIAKNEAGYFQEWLEYHKIMGVQKFYIYDNESSDDTKKILRPYINSGLIEYTFFPGARRQLSAYRDCVRRHRHDSEYIAFIDLDEFIVPLKHKTIPGYLRSLGKVSGVEINWLVYGSSGAKRREKGFVIERFRRRSRPDAAVNDDVKTIARPKKIWGFFSAHKPLILFGRYVDSNGNRIRQHFRKRRRLYDAIRINHYAVKSFQEFKNKQLRGDALFGDARHRKLDYFKSNDRNEILDPIMDKYVKKLSRHCGLNPRPQTKKPFPNSRTSQKPVMPAKTGITASQSIK